MMTARLDRVGASVANAMRVLPVAGEPGYPSPGEIAAGLALIFRARYGPMERLCGASAFLMSLDPEDLDTLLKAAQRDREPPRPFTGLSRRHRSPPLTPIEKRRAAQIPDFDDPDFLAKLGAGTSARDRRARLASAWNGASNRDRRDLVARATGRVNA